jgi:hypothetical protein
MYKFVILTTRKRVIIALVHTVVFLFIAVLGIATTVRPLQLLSPLSAWILAAVYLVVSGVLLVLSKISGNFRERLYFGLCTTSAAFGLARQVLGDPRMRVAVYIRILMLACAVLTGFVIAGRAPRRSGTIPR